MGRTAKITPEIFVLLDGNPRASTVALCEATGANPGTISRARKAWAVARGVDLKTVKVVKVARREATT